MNKNFWGSEEEVLKSDKVNENKSKSILSILCKERGRKMKGDNWENALKIKLKISYLLTYYPRLLNAQR